MKRDSSDRTSDVLFVCDLLPMVETRWHPFGSKAKSKEMILDASSLEP